MILDTIAAGWERMMFANMTMKSFFVLVYKYLTLLDVICPTYSSTDIFIAIHSGRSKHWMALYLACFIKGVNFIVLSPYIERSELFHTINFTSVNYLFTEQHLISFSKYDMQYIPFLRGAYDLESIEPISIRRSVYNNNIAHVALPALNEDLFDKNFILNMKAIYGNTGAQSHIINLTSGVSHVNYKYVVSSSNSIKKTVEGAISTRLLPFKDTDVVYSEVEFAHSHIVSVLIPFIKGCMFSETIEHCNIIIESTESFERKWYNEAEYILEHKFLYNLFRVRLFTNLINNIIGRKFRKFYASFADEIIIYNGTIQERALKMAKKYLPIHVTYGSQESNQLIACNNFSTPEYRKPGSIGRHLGTIKMRDDGELRFISDGIFTNLLGDVSHTRYLRDNTLPSIRLEDEGKIDKNGNVFLIGRMSFISSDKGYTVNLDLIERHIRSLPYIEECVLVPWGDVINNLQLVVQVNQRLVEAHKLSWDEITEILTRFYKALDSAIPKKIRLANVVILYEPFVKSFDGKIKTWIYRLD